MFYGLWSQLEENDLVLKKLFKKIEALNEDKNVTTVGNIMGRIIN